MGGDTMLAAGATSQIPPVDYDDYDDRYAPGRHGGGGASRRWIPWVLGLLLVLGVVGGVAYYLLGSSQTSSVPLVNNQPVATARSEITAAKLRCCNIVNQASNSVTKGLVINSNPSEGSNVAANTMVTLYVSSGAKQVSVPGVVGQQATQAQATLQNDGFQVQTKTDATSTQPAGQVINQNPVATTMVAPGSTVTITVSGGGIPVDSVIGDSQATAQSILQGQGFTVNVQQGTGPAQYQNGMVFNQNPTAQTLEPKGTQITIYVQNGASQSPSPSPSASNSNSGSPAPF
jgi:serine/threonine-protein kinase